jgi:hypothetical protein
MKDEHPQKEALNFTSVSPPSYAEEMLDSGRLITFANLGTCDCQTCKEWSLVPKTLYAKSAVDLYNASFVKSGLVLRALMEEWPYNKIVTELKEAGLSTPRSVWLKSGRGRGAGPTPPPFRKNQNA